MPVSNSVPLTTDQRELAAAFFPDALRLAAAAKKRVHDHRWDDEYDSAAAYTVVLAVRRYDPASGVPLRHYVLRSVAHNLRLLRRALHPRAWQRHPYGRLPRLTSATTDPTCEGLQDHPVLFDELVTRLPPQCQRDVIDRFVQDMTVDEMAERDGVCRQVIHQRLKLALDQVRERCQPA